MSCVEVSCLVDTGSTRTILSKITFDKIPLQVRKKLPKVDVAGLNLQLANVMMPVKIGSVLVDHSSNIRHIRSGHFGTGLHCTTTKPRQWRCRILKFH